MLDLLLTIAILSASLFVTCRETRELRAGSKQNLLQDAEASIGWSRACVIQAAMACRGTTGCCCVVDDQALNSENLIKLSLVRT